MGTLDLNEMWSLPSCSPYTENQSMAFNWSCSAVLSNRLWGAPCTQNPRQDQSPSPDAGLWLEMSWCPIGDAAQTYLPPLWQPEQLEERGKETPLAGQKPPNPPRPSQGSTHPPCPPTLGHGRTLTPQDGALLGRLHHQTFRLAGLASRRKLFLLYSRKRHWKTRSTDQRGLRQPPAGTSCVLGHQDHISAPPGTSSCAWQRQEWGLAGPTARSLVGSPGGGLGSLPAKPRAGKQPPPAPLQAAGAGRCCPGARTDPIPSLWGHSAGLAPTSPIQTQSFAQLLMMLRFFSNLQAEHFPCSLQAICSLSHQPGEWQYVSFLPSHY